MMVKQDRFHDDKKRNFQEIFFEKE